MSLTRRLLIIASVVMVTLFAAVGVIVESAMRDAVGEQLRQRLQAHVFALLAAADVSPSGDLSLPSELPEPRLMRPDSGLYARIDGDGFVWQSPSTIGENPNLPQSPLAPGTQEFLPLADIGPEHAFVFRYGIAWDLGGGEERRFVISIAEHERFFERQVEAFRLTLFGWIAAALVTFLVVQFILLRWTMAPLRQLGKEVGAVKAGSKGQIEDEYPLEVAPLTASLNAFIKSERENLDRQRHLLADLAHSLKTPLAVMRATLETESVDPELKVQIDRMDDIVAYQLRRGRTSGRATWAPPIAIHPQAEKVVAALERIYRDRKIDCEFDLDQGAQFTGDEGDLSEMLGNLLENAFKHANRKVLLSVRSPAANGPLRIIVEDDGPGVPEAERERIVQRGVRADERLPGHGVGLAVINDIVQIYDGRLIVARSETLGGARFEVEVR